MNLHQVLRAGVRLGLASLLGRRTLLGVGWAITNECNAICPFCAQRGGPGGLPLGKALGIIDQLAEAGCQRVHLTGGEPLLRDDLPQLLARVRARGMAGTVATNGMLLADRPELLGLCDAFVISIDGPAEVHDRYRGRGTFSRALRGIEMLHQRGERFVFSTTLFRNNLEHFEFVLELARRFGSLVVLQPGATHTIGGTALNPERPEGAPFRALIRQVLQDEQRRRLVWNSRAALTLMARYPATPSLRCHGGLITSRLDCHGDLYPCARVAEDPRYHPAPSVVTLGVAEAFRRLRAARECEGGCWAAHDIEKNLLFSGNVDAAWNLLSRNYAGRAPWRRR